MGLGARSKCSVGQFESLGISVSMYIAFASTKGEIEVVLFLAC